MISTSNKTVLFPGCSESLTYIKKSREIIFKTIWTPISILQIQIVYKEIIS